MSLIPDELWSSYLACGIMSGTWWGTLGANLSMAGLLYRAHAKQTVWWRNEQTEASLMREYMGRWLPQQFDQYARRGRLLSVDYGRQAGQMRVVRGHHGVQADTIWVDETADAYPAEGPPAGGMTKPADFKRAEAGRRDKAASERLRGRNTRR